ncbi:MAG: hypothetical protein ACYSUN_12140, partial [Planctomycetota bacterium]
ALLSNAGETALGIVIPGALDPDTYQVRARSRHDGTWSDWSNEVDFEVIAGTVLITVSDNGGAKDDAFSLFVDNVFVGTMFATPADFADTYTLALSPGNHTAMLLGVEAPDDIGTYSIAFVGVEDVTGDSTSGFDLVPGVRKFYTFTVPDPRTSQSALARVQGFDYRPQAPDPESR